MLYTNFMIAHITGRILRRELRFLVVEANNVGYKIYVSPETLSRFASSTDAKLHIFTSVKDTAIELFGFETSSELDFFEMLLDVSGIGPRSALSIIGIAPIETLKKAIASGDTSYLTKVSGIGKKMADKIVLELKDKLASLGHGGENHSMGEEADVLDALLSLGYTQYQSREALKEIDPAIKGASERIKAALKTLGR